jgi:hypothetical protein
MAQGHDAATVNAAFASLQPPTGVPSPGVPLPTAISAALTPQQPKKSLKTIVIAVSAFIVLGAGGAFAYNKFFLSPEAVLKRAIANFSKAETVEYEGNIQSKAVLPPEVTQFAPVDEGTFAISFEGAADIREPANMKSRNSVKFAIKSGSLNITLTVHARVLNDTLYLSLEQAPGGKPFDLSAISNKWVQIDFKEIEKKVDADDEPLSEQQIEDIKETLRNSRALKIKEKLADEEVEGVPAYHYTLSIDKEELKKTISEITAIVEEESAPTINDDVKAQIDAAEFPTADVWIEKKDKTFRKVMITSITKRTGGTGVDGETTFTINLKNYNQQVAITAPENARPLEELLVGLLGTFMSSAVPPPPPPAQPAF